MSVKVIEPKECPRCGGRNTKSLGADGTHVQSRVCLDCEKVNEDDCSYDVIMGTAIGAVTWTTADGKTHTIADRDWMVFQWATQLMDAAQAVIARWEHGDLAAAMRRLDSVITSIKGE